MLLINKDDKKEDLGKILARIVISAATIAISVILVMLIIAVVATVFKGLSWYLTFLFI